METVTFAAILQLPTTTSSENVLRHLLIGLHVRKMSHDTQIEPEIDGVKSRNRRGKKQKP